MSFKSKLFLIRHKCSELNRSFEEAEVLEMRERYGDFAYISQSVGLMQSIRYININTTTNKN